MEELTVNMKNETRKDHLICTADEWNAQYKDGIWGYLSDITEYARYSVVYGYIRKYLSSDGILDMGCGTGILYDLLLESERINYTGVDLSSEAIQIAKSKAPSLFHCGDINFYQPERSYDVIVFNESLQYVEKACAKLNEYFRHVTPGGAIIVSMYLHKNQEYEDYDIVQKKVKELDASKDFIVADKVLIENLAAGLKWYIYLLKRS